MKNLIISALFLSSILFSSCATQRTQSVLEETGRIIERAEQYNAAEYAPYQLSKAKGNVNSARQMLGRRRKKKALESAESALNEAKEAFRLASRSSAAVALKNARGSLKLVRRNKAHENNEELHRKLSKSVKTAEEKFMADNMDRSYDASMDAAHYADALLEPLRKEASIKIKKVQNKMREEEMDNPRLQNRLRDAKSAAEKQNYHRALNILDKILNQTK